MLTAFAILLSLTALLAWANERFLRIPTTVGVTLAGALASALLIALESTGVAIGARVHLEALLNRLDFTDFVLGGILSVLLFAGALHLDARQLLRQSASILTLAFFSTLISTALIGVVAYVVFGIVGLAMPLVWALVFGALISPTDPVAVLDLLKRAKVPAKIETLIAGEALFNDGIGIVLFLALGALAGIATGGHTVDASFAGAVGLFLREAVGGVLLGAALGAVGWYLCKTIVGHHVEVLITLALVVGGYTLASTLGVSGPLAMVVAGLVMALVADQVFDAETRPLVEGFWTTLEEVLNVLLFAFIGLDVLLAPTSTPMVLAALLLIPVALAARFASVVLPLAVVRRRDGYAAWTARLLTWGGLRGGIAIGLALALPANDYRGPILTATYAIVLFTIAVQGLTVMPIVRRAVAADAAVTAPEAVRVD